VAWYRVTFTFYKYKKNKVFHTNIQFTAQNGKFGLNLSTAVSRGFFFLAVDYGKLCVEAVVVPCYQGARCHCRYNATLYRNIKAGHAYGVAALCAVAQILSA
jgi:hypothetical protein